jgi:hypothetical protein
VGRFSWTLRGFQSWQPVAYLTGARSSRLSPPSPSCLPHSPLPDGRRAIILQMGRRNFCNGRIGGLSVGRVHLASWHAKRGRGGPTQRAAPRAV